MTLTQDKFLQAGAGAVNRTVDSKLRDTVSVFDFGATGDGVTDDTAAIQDAIDSISTGGRLHFPSGTYVINTGNFIGVDLNGFTNVEITGEVDSVILNPDAATEARPFVLRNGTGLLVEGLTFSCLETGARATNGLDIQNVNSATIRGNRFTGQTFYGLGVYEDTIDALNGTCNDLIVEDNIFEDIDTIGAEMFPKVLSTTQVIRNNRFERCGVSNGGTSFKCAQGYERSDVYDNVIISGGTLGVSTFSSSIGLYRICNFYNNTFINSNRASIAIAMAAHGLYTSETYQSLTVKDNLIANSAAHTTSTDPAITLAVEETTDYDTNVGTIVISGNHIKGYYRGFECRPIVDIDRVVVQDNVFEDISNAAFYTDDANSGVMINPSIISNTIISNLSTKTAEDIRLDAVNGSTVDGNTFIRSGDYSIRYFAPTTGIHNISNNSFIDGQVVAGPTRSTLYSNDSTAVTYNLFNNTVIGSNWSAMLSATNATPTFNFKGNSGLRPTTNSTPTRTVVDVLGEFTSNADAAVNGYITVLDADGNSIKVATIA